MKILYFSDLHIEIRDGKPEVEAAAWTDLRPLGLGPDLQPFVGRMDLLVLAGDIGRIRSTRPVQPLLYAEQAAAYLHCPAVLVPGNHEYYRGCFQDDRKALIEAQAPGITVLDRGEALFERPDGGKLRLLGATLWTDYAVLGDAEAGMRQAEAIVPDHKLIRLDAKGPGFFRPEDARAEHFLSRRWLAQKLGEPHDGPSLIVTHHPPHSAASNPLFGLTPLSPAFCSDCNDLIGAAAAVPVAAWIFGHHHWSQELEQGGVRLLTAQPGYPQEKTNWQGPGVLEI